MSVAFNFFILGKSRFLNNYFCFQCVNLSYQELGHSYQLKEFYKVLRRLLRCVCIELMDNSLSDLHMIAFPK